MALKRALLIFTAAFFIGGAFARATAPLNTKVDSVSTDTIKLSWSLDTPSNESPLMVISTSSDFSSYISSSTGSLGMETTSYYNLYSNATYYFKVKVSTEPDANYSAVISTITEPNAIEGESFLAVSSSNITVAWSASNNSDGTYFDIKLAWDPALEINSVSTQTTALAHDFSSLLPNATYFARGTTLRFSGAESIYTDFGSTITLAAEPSTLIFSAVSSTQIITSWSSNGNPAGTLYEILFSTDNFSTTETSSTTIENYYGTESLIPNTTYSFKVAAINGNSVKTAYTASVSTLSYAAIPQESGATFSNITEDSIDVQWLSNDNPAHTEYYLYVSTANDFSGMDTGSGAWFSNPLYAVTPLDSGTTFYFQVKARDVLNRETDYLYLGEAKTLAGADNNPPNILDLQSGDDNWRGSISGAYKVYFSDLGSMLSKFQIKITTGQNFSGEIISDWIDVVTLIDNQEYNFDWQLPSSAFNLISENTTSYVSVRAYDNNSNVAISTDVFYVLRDLTDPVINNNAVSPVGWQMTDPGVFDVDFEDALSGLSEIFYSASNQIGVANGNILGWTNIDSIISSMSYTSDWGVDFVALADSVTNYISVKAVDKAGNEVVLADVFKILKNTKGPTVNFTDPLSVYISTLNIVSGNSVKSVETADILLNELAFMDNGSSLYWNGVGFSSAVPVWFNPTGLEAWSLDVSTISFVNSSVYKIIARSKDMNNNYSSPYSTFSFTMDTDAPSVLISSPIAGTTVYFMDEITGTAADVGAGLASVKLSVKRNYDLKWWDFSGNWNIVQVSSYITGASSWTFIPSEALRGNFFSGMEYSVYAVALDNAAGANESSVSSTTFIVMDNIAPGQITQFSGSSGTLPGRIDLNWVASGDDGSENSLALGQFAVQYSTFAEVSFSTSNALLLISTSSVMPGATQYCTVSELNYATTYYLKIWVKDDASQWSVGSATISVLSGAGLDNRISGSIKTSDGLGVTGVLIEAIDFLGFTSKTVYTIDDGSGTFNIENLSDGVYRIQATWIENGIASSVSKDQIPMGYADTHFILNTDYLLASIDGFIPLSQFNLGGWKSLKAASVLQARFVDLYQNNRKVASAKMRADGKFGISNLLPGDYVLHIPSGDGSYKKVNIQLASGETLSIKPFGELIEKTKVYAYPNPSKNSSITFHLESDISPIEKTLRIFTIDGRLIKEFNDSNPAWTGVGTVVSPYEINWNYSNESLASGVYLYIVKARETGTGETKKIIKKFAVIR